MTIECYLKECTYHSKDKPFCYENECKNKYINKVQMLLQKKFKENRKNCLDFESVSCYNIISESENAIEITAR